METTKLTSEQFKHQFIYASSRGYWSRVGAILDMMINVIILRGHIGETISSHAGRASLEGKRWGNFVASILNKLIEPNHCGLAIGTDAGGAQALLDFYKKSDVIPS